MSTRPAHRLLLIRVVVALLSATILLPKTVAAGSGPAGTNPTGSEQSAARTLYIVVQSAPPVALYQGGVAGLAATNPEARGETKLNAGSTASQAYRDHLRSQRAALVNLLGASVGRDLDVTNHYDFALNGFSVSLTSAEAVGERVEQLGPLQADDQESGCLRR